jgi:hypothetical protein
VCTWVVRVYLCAFLTGCAAHRPQLAEPTVSETHLLMGDERNAFQSCVAVLRDAGYTIEDADADEGVIRGSLVTHERLGSMDDESQTEKLMPGWQVGVAVLTGAALLVAGVLSLSQGLQGKDASAENRVSAALVMLDLATNIELPPPIVYEYQIAIQLVPMEGNTTQVRVLLEGSERQEGEGQREGAVRAPEFLAWFYSALDQSMSPEPEDQLQQALSTR